MAADPFDFVRFPADGSDALQAIEERLRRFAATSAAGLPPFQGGAAGLFGYDLGRSLERVPSAKTDEFRVPALAVGFYDVVVAFDHVADRAWIISQGFPEVEPSRRQRRAAQRLAEVRNWIAEPVRSRWHGSCTAMPGRQCNCHSNRANCPRVCPQHAIPGVPGVTSNFSRTAICRRSVRAIDYIYAGDVFQVNLSQRLLVPARDDTVDLYRRLRRCNPAPFAGYFDLGDFQIVSASPERFLRVP